MRRTALAGLMLVLQAVFVVPANASGALSPSLYYNPVWNATGVKITFTYKAPAAGYPCPMNSPIGNPVRFRMDGTIFNDGTLLDSNCTATATLTMPQAKACAAHTFTAALHNAGDSTTASETGQASIAWPADYPTMGPYGCRTPGPIPQSSTPVIHIPPPVSTTATQARPTPTPIVATHTTSFTPVNITPPTSTATRAAAHTTAPAIAHVRTTSIAPSPSSTMSPTPSETPTAAALDRQPSSDSSSPALWIFAAASLLIASGAASGLILRRRRSRG